MVKATYTPAGSDVTGEVSSGHLTLSGRMATAHCFVFPNEYNNQAYDYVLNAKSINRYLRKLYPDIPFHEKREAMVEPGLELYCLEIAESDSGYKWFLVLERSLKEPGAYERVGMLEILRDPLLIAGLQSRSQVAMVKIL